MNRIITFVILMSVIFSSIIGPTFAAPNNEFKAINKIPSTNLNIDELILVEGNTASMSADIKNGKLHIKDNLHTNRKVRLNYLELFKSIKGFNGKTLGYTHIDDYGISSHKIINVGDIDYQGFIAIDMTFSTVIIDGFTGTTTITLNGLSGNQSISVPDGSSYDLNITNNQLGIVNATGGILTTDGYYNIHTFVSNGSFTPDNIFLLSYLIAGGGGGGGGGYYGGGGGAGGYKYNSDYNVTSNPYAITVGAGGIGGLAGNPSAGNGTNGENSTFDGITSNGGGFGGTQPNIDGNDGSSGGGSSITGTSEGLGIAGQGYDGGTSGYSQSSGGGGGADEVGHNAVSDTIAGDGGNGSESDISGSNITYCDGGAGGEGFGTDEAVGGSGNGGSGGSSTDGATDGVDGTGSGGGGSGQNPVGDGTGGDGGDGVVILRYNTMQGAGTSNITASITGDSNTQSYNTTQTRTFTLTPTGTTNNVNTNTTSTDYDITIVIYWTEDTIKYSESVDNGYANITIQYTPSFNITNGVINATYNLITFLDHDYVGQLYALVDGVNYTSNATRVGEDVNVSIVNFDNSTHWINFSVPYNPPLELYTPTDNAILNFTFPPLNHDVVLTWMNTTGTYKYEVYQGPVIKRTGTVSTNSTTVSLPAGDYTWMAYGYDDVFNEYSPDTEAFDFTISTNITYVNTTGVHGVVYDYLIGIETPLENAGVYIWNDTFSSSTITGANGYFVFTGLSNSTYYLIVKKDRYYDSSTEVVTLTTNNMTEHNIRLIENTGTDYNKHYVKFILKSFFGTLYSNVLANVYIGDSTTVFQTDTTGDDGSVTFELTQSQEYRFTFVNVPQSIDITKVITPSDTLYNIIVFGANIIPDAPAQDDILYSVQGININTTQGFINVSFTDTSGTTTFAEVLIKDKNTLATLYQFNTTDSTGDWSQIVDAGNASYVVVFNIDNTILEDTLSITKTVYFDNEVNINLGLENNWSYILIAVIIITTVALLSSRLNAEIMAVITVLTGWTMIFFGWLTAGVSLSGKITIWMMMLLATLIAFATVIKKGDR